MTAERGVPEPGRWHDRSLTPGLAAWLVQRVTSLVLLVVVPVKVLSGWAMAGELSWGTWFANLHTNRVLDIVVIAAVAYHALFGLRALLIDAGFVDFARRATIPLGVIGGVITGWAVVLVQ